jgi:hypothetical protein
MRLAWALDAYAKALEFDPDDVESLLWIGSIQVDRGYLDEAQRRPIAYCRSRPLIKHSTGIGRGLASAMCRSRKATWRAR